MGSSKIADDPSILLIIVVTVAGNFGVGSIIYSIFSPRVPNAQSLPFRVPTSFNLIKGLNIR